MDTLYLYHELEHLLRQEPTYCMADGQLIKNKIVEDAFKLEPHLLHLLVSHKDLKDKFFQEVDGMWVFDKVEFERFVMNKSFLADSYTSFKNKVGLSVEDGRFISESREVVLSWPYKDCMLEGGQTKEDAKRDEIFWNETLAPEEINRLKEPKAFTNFKRFDKDGEHSVDSISDSDNLIIKGNNLLALYSLKKKYAGKVKLIYIDPPYYFTANKKEDTFKYNSNFKLSTWCTFMKDRLLIAKELLSNDGSIFVQISDDGVAELHLLLKEIFCSFGENNFINKIAVKTKSPSGFASVNPGVFETAEYILGFAKHKANWNYKPQYVKTGYDANYAFYIENIDDECEKWKIERIDALIARNLGYKDKRSALAKINKFVFEQMVSEFALKNKERVFRLTSINDNAASDTVELREVSKKEQGKVFCQEKDNSKLYILNGQEIAFYQKKIRCIDGELCPSIQLSNIWIDTPYEGIAKEGKVSLKGGKKPEKLIRRILEMATQEGDLVLDFHLGSGTTAAVAHKIHRRYIGIEQLDYGNNDSVVRLQNVINGDQSGISKSVNWQGGGSFVYCELAKANEQFVEEIEVAKNTAELKEVWTRMEKSGYLCYRLNVESFEKEATTFEQLSLENQKRFLMECLDKNLLYVPLSDVDSNEYRLSDEDRRLTKEFYRK